MKNITQWKSTLLGMLAVSLWFIQSSPDDFKSYPMLVHFAHFALGTEGVVIFSLFTNDEKINKVLGITSEKEIK